MSDEFQVGDVVVCVRSGRDRRGTVRSTGRFLRLGSIYRLRWVGMTAQQVPGVMLCGDPAGDSGAWAADRFRKLPRADEEFTRQIRACKPQRTPAHTGAPQ